MQQPADRPSRSGYAIGAGFVAATLAVLAYVLLANGPGAPSKSALERLRAAAAAASCSLARFPSEGRVHTLAHVHYRTNPPTSGPHNPIPARDGVYSAAPLPEHYVHTLEHGRIELQYRPDAPAEVRDALHRVYDQSTHHMLLFPNNTGMHFEVAATAWKHRLGCARFDAKVPAALSAFRDAYRDHAPEQVP